MAAAATYVIKTVTFKGQLMDGVEDVQVGQEGDVVTHAHDGLITATATFIDNVKATVRVTSRNGSWFSDSDFDIGATGSLVVVQQKRAAGKGAVAGQDKTATFAEATVVRVGSGAPHADRGTFEVEFECVAAAGVTPVAFT